MNGSAAIFYCDRSGVMAQPWAEAGYECWCIDIAHSIRRPRKDGNINFVWGDVRSCQRPTRLPIAFFAAFPPCTHVAGSGARDFELKGGAMLRDALELFEACHAAASWSGAPYCIENPVGVLANVPHIGKPDYYFEPWHFAGYADDPNAEAYTKKTCLWTGNSFCFPDKRPIEPALGSAILNMPPSDDREKLRSLTPQGFARAVFAANGNRIERKAA